MGISRKRACDRYRRKQVEKTLKLIINPPVIAATLGLCMLTDKPIVKKRRKKKKWF